MASQKYDNSPFLVTQNDFDFVRKDVDIVFGE